MQTFLIHPEKFHNSAKLLDNSRLGKQRVEAYQILTTNQKHLTANSDPWELKRIGWRNHPAVVMWRSYEGLLCLYGIAMCKEWKARGFEDNLLDIFLRESVRYPLIIPSTDMRSVADSLTKTIDSCKKAQRGEPLGKVPDFHRARRLS